MTSGTKRAIKSAASYALLNALRTMTYGVLVVMALLIPSIVLSGEDFMKVHDLTICPAGTVSSKCLGADHDMVRQERSPAWPMRLQWRATIYRLRPVEVDDAQVVDMHEVVCHGGGDHLYRPRLTAIYFTVPTWVGAPCELRSGERYAPYAQWTYSWGLWSWTVDHMGDPVAIPPRNG